MLVICCPASAGGFLFLLLLHLVDLFPEQVNKAVKFKAVLLASKSNIFYHPNPSTKGFTVDPSFMPFTTAISWDRSP